VKAPTISPKRLQDIERAAWSTQDQQDRNDAEREAAAVQFDNRARLVQSWMSDAGLRDLARQRAALMTDNMQGMVWRAEGAITRASIFARLGLLLGTLEARPMKDTGQDLGGVLKRVQCVDWWARQLKRRAVLLREHEGRAAGTICAKRRQTYVTDDTVRRMIRRDQRNRAMLEKTEIENSDGHVMTLAQASDTSTANPVIRRGELMTRIRGCEEWADANGWEGIFTTNTTPSAYHATLHTGTTNPKWIEAGKPDTKEGQAWLCKTWAQCRAALQRRGLTVFGFRVAEPHQDGTPHWHMLVWTKPGHREFVQAMMNHYWLRDAPNEPGAKEHRFKAKHLIAGGAAGYVAKYISKGIDDEGDTGVSGHIDDTPGGQRVAMEQGEMFGGGATRVRAWARAHGIRQFQPIGQPPVTVWRELRRVEQEDARTSTDRMLRLWHSVNRDGERRASWGEFMTYQGGACVGRDYAVGVAKEAREVVGKYETEQKPFPVGVVDRVSEWKRGEVVPSQRKQWRPRGTWAPQAAGVVIVGLCDVTRAKDWKRGLKNGCSNRVGVDQGPVVGMGGAGGGSGDWLAPVLGLKASPQGAAAWTRENNCTDQAQETGPLGVFPEANHQGGALSERLRRARMARQHLRQAP
jgi:hypothetical protein